MKRHVLISFCIAGLLAVSAHAQSGGAAGGGGGGAAGGAGASGAGIGPAGNSTAGTANGTSVNTQNGVNTGVRQGTMVTRPEAGLNGQQQLPPGVSRQQLPPGLQRDQLPPGLQNRDNLPPGLSGQQQLPPGLQNRQNLPPGVGGEQLPNGANQNVLNRNQQLSRVPRYGANTNTGVQSFTNNTAANGFPSNTVSWYSNQFGAISNQVTTVGTNGLATGAGVFVGTGTTEEGTANGITTQQGTVGQAPLAPRAPAAPAASGATTARTSVEERGDKAYTANDQSLLLRVRNDVAPLFGGTQTGSSPLRIVMRNGEATLSGFVPTAEIRDRVLRAAQQTPGVLNVVDQMTIGTQAGNTRVGGSANTGEGASTGQGNSQGLTPNTSLPPRPQVLQTNNPTLR